MKASDLLNQTVKKTGISRQKAWGNREFNDAFMPLFYAAMTPLISSTKIHGANATVKGDNEIVLDTQPKTLLRMSIVVRGPKTVRWMISLGWGPKQNIFRVVFDKEYKDDTELSTMLAEAVVSLETHLSKEARKNARPSMEPTALIAALEAKGYAGAVFLVEHSDSVYINIGVIPKSKLANAIAKYKPYKGQKDFGKYEFTEVTTEFDPDSTPKDLEDDCVYDIPLADVIEAAQTAGELETLIALIK